MLVGAENATGRAFPSPATFMRGRSLVRRTNQASPTPLLAAFPNPSARPVLLVQFEAPSVLLCGVSVSASATAAASTASASTTSAGDRLCSFRNMRKIAMAVWTFSPRLLFLGSSAHVHGFRAARAETHGTLDHTAVVIVLVVS
jgi:hypothetical protein